MKPPESRDRCIAADPVRFGKYRVLRKIASGGMAEVYLCRLTGEEGFRKRVALKVVHPRYASDPRFRKLFAREARVAASLSHPNVIQVFDFGREGGSLYLAMEYVEGWSLAQAASHARQLGVTIPGGVWRLWVEGIWSGLSYLHERGVLHRDVSPGNVLVGRAGVVKLTDFGISRTAAEEAEEAEEAGTRAGKIAYFSPERARGEAASVSSDLFAAAAISAELLLGRPLFAGERSDEILERIRRFDGYSLEFPGIPVAVADMIRTGLAGDPSKRYLSAGEWLAALDRQGPARVSFPDLADFWDSLFPAAAEEETAPALRPGPDSSSDMVKESPERYGIRGKGLQVGAAAAFAVLTAGGVLLWMEGKVADRAVVPPPVSVPKAGSSSGPTDSVPEPHGSPEAVRETASRQRRNDPPPPTLPRVSAVVETAPSAPGAPALPVRHLVRIETEPGGAAISLANGDTIGRTPSQVDAMSVGEKGVVLSKEGYERKAVPAAALLQGVVFRTELEPVLGTVEAIQAIPWAKVYLGGRFLGETPLTSVLLPVGEQRLRFVNEPLGVDRTESLLVRPGGNPKLIVPLTGTGRR